MDREQAVKYLQSSGFSDEQIKAIEGAFTCDKCVYSTNEGCQYDDITETIPPFEDCISRQAVLKIIDGWYDNNRDTENIEDLIVLITYMCSVNPQKPICPSAGIDCEDCPAYEPKTGWISVSERLPEKADLYLVNFDDGAYHLAYFINGACDYSDVIAWMPLPEPYRAESET